MIILSPSKAAAHKHKVHLTHELGGYISDINGFHEYIKFVRQAGNAITNPRFTLEQALWSIDQGFASGAHNLLKRMPAMGSPKG